MGHSADWCNTHPQSAVLLNNVQDVMNTNFELFYDALVVKLLHNNVHFIIDQACSVCQCDNHAVLLPGH